MTLVSPNERLSSLQETHKEIQNLIAELPLNPSLAAQIHSLLRSASLKHESLSDDLPASSPLQPKLSKLSEDLRILHSSFRRTLLQAHRAAQAALHAPSEPPNPSDNPVHASLQHHVPARERNAAVSKTDIALTTSSDVTTALQRTRFLMSQELEKSAFAASTLAESSEALKELSTRYNAFDDVLSRSKDLVRDLVKKNKSDRWYYEMAIRILVGTMVWILFRRIFYGPLWLIFGVPIKVAVGTVGFAARTVGLGRKAQVEFGGQGPAQARGDWENLKQAVVEQSGGDKEEHVVEFGRGELERESDRRTMIEVVEKIIGGGETTIIRNTKSRNFHYDPEEEAAAATMVILREQQKKQPRVTEVPSNEEQEDPRIVNVEEDVPVVEEVIERLVERVRDEL